jgi:hypothetical protein
MMSEDNVATKIRQPWMKFAPTREAATPTARAA